MTGGCGASFSSNAETNSFGRATLISSDIEQTKTLKKGHYVTRKAKQRFGVDCK